MKSRNISIIITAAILLILSNSAFAYRQVIDLGTLYDSTHTEAWSINNNGQIVGRALTPLPDVIYQAVLFDSTGNGNNIDLGTLPNGGRSRAHSINNKGQIVGSAVDSLGATSATLFDPTGNGNNIHLGSLPGYVSSIAWSINDNSQIVGVSEGWATLFDITGAGNNIDLGFGTAYSINNNGQIVGSSNSRATIFDITGAGNNIDLGILPGGGSSLALSNNEIGQIVGFAYNASGSARATLFDITGTGNNIDLGDGYARSINNNGQIVGYSGSRATLFDITGAGNNIDLNTLIAPELGWTLTNAYSINDNGWIVGWGTNPDSETHAFLLTPEPATLLLLTLGGLALRKRKPQIS